MTLPKGEKPSTPEASAEPPNPFLGHELRVGLTDGRVLVGVLLAYEGSGDLLLQGAIEERAYQKEPTTGVTVRDVNLLAIPFRCVKTLHRRRQGVEPLSATWEAERNRKAAALPKA